MCDCSAIKEILEYMGSIPMVCRWAQELLGYQFTVVHRPNRMMVDVDSLTRRYGPLIAMHCMVSYILHRRDVVHKPLAYDRAAFLDSKTAKLTSIGCEQSPTPILFNGFITQTCTAYFKDNNATVITKYIPILSSCPILYTASIQQFPSGNLPMEDTHDNWISASSKSLFFD